MLTLTMRGSLSAFYLPRRGQSRLARQAVRAARVIAWVAILRARASEYGVDRSCARRNVFSRAGAWRLAHAAPGPISDAVPLRLESAAPLHSWKRESTRVIDARADEVRYTRRCCQGPAKVIH